MNTFGDLFRLTTFGESHGTAIGGVIDGCPSRLTIDMELLQTDLRRRSGEDMSFVSSRAQSEKDEVEFLSGVLDGVSEGTPIAFLIRNSDARSSDYETLRSVLRPGHADEAYLLKYGIRDHRGGGRSSARETIARVVGGSIAKQLLRAHGMSLEARVVEVGGKPYPSSEATDLLAGCAREGDSVGGVVELLIQGMAAGVGEPLFGKLQAVLASALMSIPAAKGFEYGSGFAAAKMRGSESNEIDDGISGGISTGADIRCRVAFKPTPSIHKPQTMRVIDEDGRVTEQQITLQGRHDVCVALRAPVVVEAMAAMAIVNLIYKHNNDSQK